MKVLQINAVYEYSSTGRNVKESNEYMLKKGIESYVAAPKLYGLRGNSYKIGNKLDMKVHALLSRLMGLQGYFSAISTKKLIKYIEKLNPDIIHLNNLHGNYINIGMLLRYISKHDIATVITLHDTWFYTGKCCHYLEDNCYKWKNECGKCPAKKKYNKSWFFDFSRKMQRDKIKWFDAVKKLGVVGVSSWITEAAKESAILGNAAIIETIFNWIDLDKFKPHDTLTLRQELNIEEKFVILGIAQSWSAQKGLDIFIELSKFLPEDCLIILVGNASEDTVKANTKIKFIGTVNDVNLLADYYSMADVFINPSIQETFGKTTAEALAAGTPVIGFNSTATPELVGRDGKCGVIVEKQETAEYLKAVEYIKAKTKSYFTEPCRKRAEENFDKAKNIEKYIDLYERLQNG